MSKKCPYSEFFWWVFSRDWIEHGDLQFKSPCSVQMRENTDQKNSKYGQFSRGKKLWNQFQKWILLTKLKTNNGI